MYSTNMLSVTFEKILYTYFDMEAICVQNNSTIKIFNYVINTYLHGKISGKMYVVIADFMERHIALMTSAINKHNLQQTMISANRAAANFVKRRISSMPIQILHSHIIFCK